MTRLISNSNLREGYTQVNNSFIHYYFLFRRKSGFISLPGKGVTQQASTSRTVPQWLHFLKTFPSQIISVSQTKQCFPAPPLSFVYVLYPKEYLQGGEQIVQLISLLQGGITAPVITMHQSLPAVLANSPGQAGLLAQVCQELGRQNAWSVSFEVIFLCPSEYDRSESRLSVQRHQNPATISTSVR